MKVSELKEWSNERIIARIFRLGIMMSNNSRPHKCDEESLKRCFKELGRRGVLEDWEQAYELTKN